MTFAPDLVLTFLILTPNQSFGGDKRADVLIYTDCTFEIAQFYWAKRLVNKHYLKLG